MFASIDEGGKVLLTTVSKVVFMFTTSKQIIVDPLRMPPNQPKYTTLAAKF